MPMRSRLVASAGVPPCAWIGSARALRYCLAGDLTRSASPLVLNVTMALGGTSPWNSQSNRMELVPRSTVGRCAFSGTAEI